MRDGAAGAVELLLALPLQDGPLLATETLEFQVHRLALDRRCTARAPNAVHTQRKVLGRVSGVGGLGVERHDHENDKEISKMD